MKCAPIPIIQMNTAYAMTLSRPPAPNPKKPNPKKPNPKKNPHANRANTTSVINPRATEIIDIGCPQILYEEIAERPLKINVMPASDDMRKPSSLWK